ncbi:RYamide receptor-like [Schistocerca gregaria]|uniref:RYamide receptor-like n=1 Tax=Schistocerca gregaria TaxID=7010 RepID=UPI00211E7AE2|nr:RYamide receptor-like [Schistocerca gregaria]
MDNSYKMASSDVEYYDTETVTADDDSLTNSTTNMCEMPGSAALSSTPFVALVVVLYGVIMLGSVVGNGLVVYTITGNRAMRTVTNLLLLNLALGDLLLTLVCIPFVALPVLILQHWPFGLLLCQLVSCVQGIGVLVSAYTLIAVSLDRYRALRWPLRARLEVRADRVASDL